MAGEVKQRSPGSWQIRVFLGRDEHGKRIRKNETVHGKKADAERRLREILSQMDRGMVPSLERYKLGEWLELWLNDVIAPEKEQKTFDRYEEASRLRVVPQDRPPFVRGPTRSRILLPTPNAVFASVIG